MSELMRLADVEAIIREEVATLRTPPERMRRYDPDERELIRSEENGCRLLADCVIQRLRARAAEQHDTGKDGE